MSGDAKFPAIPVEKQTAISFQLRDPTMWSDEAIRHPSQVRIMSESARFPWGMLAKLFAFVTGAAILIGLIIPASHRSAGPAARRTQCMSNIRNIALALLNYSTANGGHLPPAFIADESGRPMHSWRTLILPYIDRPDLYAAYRFDEPWDGPNNSKLHNVSIEVFRCPEDEAGVKSMHTSYVAIVGPETAWPGANSVSLDTIAGGDGTSQTVLLAEVVNSGIHWMEPRDLPLSQMAPTINPKAGNGISSRHPGMAIVAFADGRVKPLADSLSAAKLRALLTINGKEPLTDGDF